MVTELHKDLFAVILKHWGEYDSITKTTPHWNQMNRTIAETMCLWSFLMNRGNQCNASERIGINRNTMRTYLRDVLGEIPKARIADRRQYAREIGLW